MKLVILACLAVMAAARPQEPVAEIVTDERSDSGDGNFNFAFETSDGTRVSAVGTPGGEGQVNIQGEYSYRLSDGTEVLVRYIANENGFQPESEWLPTPHPLPAHAIEQIRIAEQQRAEGITFE
ncbi:hypothetical protein Pmani_023828 [Petrolisthes manimaculis]|uniref:Uncharacterized protein n=1 Tax=Petrolisthes manimaculis TaxID=1843537 RepID=A0AAE1P901_9EUCA|nr:hypothetical protein Pmani_023827 [Petrolisthes manimaculis]KAK4304194.1 hypothetical protein Pmani_023828 [Petrolisthes manimaculis]